METALLAAIVAAQCALARPGAIFKQDDCDPSKSPVAARAMAHCQAMGFNDQDTTHYMSQHILKSHDAAAAAELRARDAARL